MGARREPSRRAFLFACRYVWDNGLRPAVAGEFCPTPKPLRTRSEAAEVDRLRARSAAGFDDSLAAVDGGAAVLAVMTADIMPIAGRRRCGRPGGIADDRGWLAWHDRLRGRRAVAAFCSSVVEPLPRVQASADESCFRNVSWQHAGTRPPQRVQTFRKRLSGLALAKRL